MFYGSQKDQSFYFHVGTKQHRDKYKRSEFARSLFFQYKKKKNNNAFLSWKFNEKIKLE